MFRRTSIARQGLLHQTSFTKIDRVKFGRERSIRSTNGR
jgi:hypothetical protein